MYPWEELPGTGRSQNIGFVGGGVGDGGGVGGGCEHGRQRYICTGKRLYRSFGRDRYLTLRQEREEDEESTGEEEGEGEGRGRGE